MVPLEWRDTTIIVKFNVITFVPVNFSLPNYNSLLVGGRVGLVVRALAFHQCGPGSISALGAICGLSLLVLYSAMRGFSSDTPVFPLVKNQHLI